MAVVRVENLEHRYQSYIQTLARKMDLSTTHSKEEIKRYFKIINILGLLSLVCIFVLGLLGMMVFPPSGVLSLPLLAGSVWVYRKKKSAFDYTLARFQEDQATGAFK